MLDQNCCIKRSSNSADLLCQLVRDAQKNDPKAIEELCERFKPLIYKECSNSYFRDILGEDLENIAWLIFLELIHKYQYEDPRYFPGFVHKSLHYALLKSCNKKFSLSQKLELFANEDGNLDAIDPRNSIQDIEEAVHLEALLDCLPPTQKAVLNMFFIKGYSLMQISEKLNRNYNSVYAAYRKGISKIKNIIE